MTRVIVCCDGLAPSYLGSVETPGFDAIAEDGRAGTCAAAMPSLTNVNNVSIATAAPPAVHGITGNSYLDDGAVVYMEDPSYLRRETRFQELVARGDQVGALVAKRKLERMICRDCSVGASAESPPTWLEEAVGAAPDIYSGEASAWLIDAGVHVLETRDLDWLYVSTTDVVPHKHAPEEPEATAWVEALDAGVAAMADHASDIVVTADHGMSAKTHCIDLEAMLDREGYETRVIRLIRDKHTYHHQNLGGAAYVYVADEADREGVADVLGDVEGIDLLLDRTEAADRFDLPADRIGDFLVLGTEPTVFGPVDDGETATVALRSHGSHHEREVPYVTSTGEALEANYDAFAAFE